MKKENENEKILIQCNFLNEDLFGEELETDHIVIEGYKVEKDDYDYIAVLKEHPWGKIMCEHYCYYGAEKFDGDVNELVKGVYGYGFEYNPETIIFLDREVEYRADDEKRRLKK